MCTILFAYKTHPEYDFIFLGNRDEFRNRPSKEAHFWSTHPNVLAGIDLEKGGTWTGVSKEGRIAFLTNHRDGSILEKRKVSRGNLTRDFLTGNMSPLNYLMDIQNNREDYDPFNLVVGSQDELYFYSNIENKISIVKPGVYGLSNAFLDTPWYKVEKAKNRFMDLLDTDFSVDQLFEILSDTEKPPVEELPDTGVSLEWEKTLSSICIDTPEYGTQFKTVMLFDNNKKVQFHEKIYDNKGSWNDNNSIFNIY
jgi:uncharacterized protein with NRDE domain